MTIDGEDDWRSSSSVRVLVTDIDGTLLDEGVPTPGLATLRLLIENQQDAVRVVYATGRSFFSTWKLVLADVLPVPDSIASSVGTEVWLPPCTGVLERLRARYFTRLG